MENETWQKGTVTLGFFDLINTNKNIQEVAQDLISKEYFNGVKLKPEWVRNFKDEVLGHNHYLTFEYLVLDGVVQDNNELGDTAQCWMHLIGENQ